MTVAKAKTISPSSSLSSHDSADVSKRRLFGLLMKRKLMTDFATLVNIAQNLAMMLLILSKMPLGSQVG